MFTQYFRTLLIGGLLFSLASCAHWSNEAALETQQIERWTQQDTIYQLQQKMQQQQLSAVQLTQFYLDKIATQDAQYNSVIAVNPDALAIAQAMYKELKNGQVRSPLHGIPIILKDNIETQDMPTTAGSLALQNNQTKRDATLSKNLRDAGAIILAKANLSEWANIRSERSSSGWSAVGGQTKNPHDVTRSACGSSSGSGAVIAANFAVAAVGTETNGSITCPASITGVVGVKPTVGLVSRSGIVPISHTQDTAGPMTKNVTDAAILLQYMSSEDDTDSATKDYDFKRNVNYLADKKRSAKALSQLKLGLLQSSATSHEAVAALETALVELLEAQSVPLTKELQHKPYDGFWSDTYTVLLFELKHTLNHYLANLPNPLNQLTLEKLIQFNRDNKEQEMRFFQQEIFEKAQQKDSLKNPDYQQALSKIRNETRSSINQKMDEHQLDALIAITRGPAWKIDKINGDHASGGVSTYSAVSGYPHITIPLGKVFGLPIGLSIMGKANQEQQLFEIAYALEQLLKESPVPDVN